MLPRFNLSFVNWHTRYVWAMSLNLELRQLMLRRLSIIDGDSCLALGDGNLKI
jgi:hypothetical protein